MRSLQHRPFSGGVNKPCTQHWCVCAPLAAPAWCSPCFEEEEELGAGPAQAAGRTCPPLPGLLLPMAALAPCPPSPHPDGRCISLSGIQEDFSPVLFPSSPAASSWPGCSLSALIPSLCRGGTSAALGCHRSSSHGCSAAFWVKMPPHPPPFPPASPFPSSNTDSFERD